MENKKCYVVAFGCPGEVIEYVIRMAESPEEAMAEPDDLGCPAIGAELESKVRISGLWYKNGELRCKISGRI